LLYLLFSLCNCYMLKVLRSLETFLDLLLPITFDPSINHVKISLIYVLTFAPQVGSTIGVCGRCLSCRLCAHCSRLFPTCICKKPPLAGVTGSKSRGLNGLADKNFRIVYHCWRGQPVAVQRQRNISSGLVHSPLHSPMQSPCA